MDQPNAVSQYLEKEMTGESSVKYNLLYSVYSFPNIILPLFGGIFIDRLGLKYALHILFLLCILGQALFTFGGYTGHNQGFIYALFGRFLFGMGNESLNIVQSVFASKWFKGKELAFVLALGLSMGRLGSTMNNLLMPIIAEGTSLGTALFFGLILLFVCYSFGLILLRMEKKAEEHEIPLEGPVNTEKIEFSSIKKFPFSYWLITLSCISIYAAIFPFMNISNNFYIHQYHFDQKGASRYTSSVFIIAATF